MNPEAKLQSLLNQLEKTRRASDLCSERLLTVEKIYRTGYRELKNLHDRVAKTLQLKINQHRQKHWLWD